MGTLDGKPLRGNVNRLPLPAPAPTAETYFEKKRLIEDMFCHEKLEVYQKSVELLNRLLVLFASSRTEIAILSTSGGTTPPPFGGHAVKAGFKGLNGIGAGAGNGKRFTFPRTGFSTNVPTLIGEQPYKLVGNYSS